MLNLEADTRIPFSRTAEEDSEKEEEVGRQAEEQDEGKTENRGRVSRERWLEEEGMMKETAVSVFERHESELDYKHGAKGAKRSDEPRPEEKERKRETEIIFIKIIPSDKARNQYSGVTGSSWRLFGSPSSSPPEHDTGPLAAAASAAMNNKLSPTETNRRQDTMTGRIEGLERFESPGKGRGLRVSRAFKAGELLFSSPAYSYVLTAKERGCYCEFCFNRKNGLAKCGKCRKAFYCNVKCQKGDWAMHKLECSAMNAFGENWCPSETSRLVARILAKKKTQKERCLSEKILLIEDVQSHVEDVDNQKREMTESDIAGLYRFFSKHLDFPDHKELLTLFSQVACNGFTIEDDELSHLGTAIYPDVALINHSCLHSVIVTYKGTSAEIRAVRDMKPGDEVLISYIDLLYPTDDRNSRLRESYYFTCDCQECKTQSKDKKKLKVRKRSDPIEPEVVSNMVRYARKSIREFRAFKHVKYIL
ncbi:unnamed protein product [Pleuronectes platessa]|uniref:[histone H3]-lysine(4) N-trimethyltransferase n=1 Tax=Pleuronectes platessa TaxID=8262 RepID=A0A9N7UR48_PLEPL|nr:unnamed protein product [Pleuronectes platessa]